MDKPKLTHHFTFSFQRVEVTPATLELDYVVRNPDTGTVTIVLKELSPMIVRTIERLAADPDVKQLALRIDSPDDPSVAREHEDLAEAQFCADWSQGRFPIDPSLFGFTAISRREDNPNQ